MKFNRKLLERFMIALLILSPICIAIRLFTYWNEINAITGFFKGSSVGCLLYNIAAFLVFFLCIIFSLNKKGKSLAKKTKTEKKAIFAEDDMLLGGKNVEETAEKINIEAAGEVARLMRLLRIGGMIVVDFIDMASYEAKERLLQCMRAALAEDPIKTMVYGITHLGLMEITRRRGETPLEALRDIPCPHCAGTGVITESEDDLADA